MQFLSENRLNGCQIFGQFGFQKPNPNRISIFSVHSYCTDLMIMI